MLLGLREVLGGSPDHLEVVEVRAPVDGGDRSVLVLHDTVPGGTGYLADFARPSRVRELLAAAYDVVANCRCQDADGILACHRCLLPFAPSPAAVDRTSRARAQQLLGEILSRGEVDGYPADESLWVTENVTSLRSVPPPSPESHLEQRFRTLLVEALKARGADVTEEPHVDGAVVHINMPGVRRRQWTLRPQPTLLGTQPDFVLLTEDPSVPRMYIYTDGYHFHATSATNRLADDAEKRAGLRREGHVVWAVTAGDLDAFEGVASGRSVTPPQWFTHQVQQRLTQLRGKLIPAGSVGDDALRANALTQIIDWIASPDRQGWQRLASGLPLAFWGEDGRSTFERDELPAAARALLDGEAVPESTTDGLPAWWWHADGLVLVAASPSTPRFDVGAWVVIDDRDEALDAHDARATWRMWLSLSNVLGLAERPPFIETMSRLESAAAEVGIDTQVVPSSVLATEPEASLTEEWQALMTEALEDERSALEVVARAGVPLPELGYETERGVPVDIAWPDQHVAVLVADSSDDGLTEDGWTVLRVGVDDVAERLPSLLAREEAGG
ncbi:MAG TPA: DUF1998 domain-containing protein [Actinomycetaceae bacterium]|nr:DUF1998 domain-containing protein [Actinomycetaceae bacterium]